MPITGQTSVADKDGIVYEIDTDEAGVSEQIGQTTSGLSVVCEVPYDQAEKWKQEMLGYARIDGSNLLRVLPETCGWDDSLYCLQLDRVKSVRGASVDEVLDPDNNDWPTFENLYYQALFAAPLYQVLEDWEVDYEHERFCVWTRQLVTTAEKIPGGGFFFADGKKLAEVGVKTGRKFDLTCKWIDVPQVNIANVSACANKINDAAITLNGETYSTGTVLFLGMQEDRRRNAFSQYTTDVTFRLSIVVDGRTWNQFWRKNAAGAVVYEAVADTNGDPPYASADLNTLWQV